MGASRFAVYLWMLLTLGCSDPPAPLPAVRVEAPAEGLRDAKLVAPEEDAGAEVTWSNGAETVAGWTLPAGRQVPGDQWTVTLRSGSGKEQSLQHPIPKAAGGNVLVLLLDDVGVDKIGSYQGGYAARTPRIDALATQGIRFTNAYAAPMCSPSRAVLLTGRYSRRTGIGTITEKESKSSELPVDVVMIPEALDFAPGGGWANAAIGKWHLAGPAAPDWKTHPNRHGFDWFEGTRGNPEYKEDRGYAHWKKNTNGVLSDSDTYLTTASVDDALARIAGMPEPWFLYLAFNAPHVPLHVPPAELLPGGVPEKLTPVARYDAMLEALDTEIGRLLDSVEPEVLGRTTVFTLGDNGTSKMGFPKGKGPGATHIKHSVFEGGVRVPLIVTGPLVTHPGSKEPALVHIADLFPTIADIAGLPLGGPEGNQLVLPDQTVPLDGYSMLPLLRGQPGSRAHVYSEAFEPNGPGPYVKDHRALRSTTHKLVRRNGKESFYKLDSWWEKKDLLETKAPLSPEDQAAYDDLKARLDEMSRSMVYVGR